MERILAGHTHGGPKKNDVQPLVEHCRTVADICSAHCKTLGLFHVGYLTGLLHDLGKANNRAQLHYYEDNSDNVDHASAGMRWIWETAQKLNPDAAVYLTAQIIALAVGYHHSERPDILLVDPRGKNWFDRMHSTDADKLYAENCRVFFSKCIPEAELLAEFQKSVAEIRALSDRLKRSRPQSNDKLAWANSICLYWGFIQRFLFSALIDADWADTARFMNGLPKTFFDVSVPDWDFLSARSEEFFASLSPQYPIDKLRQEISDQCFAAGKNAAPGILRLYVPTGGGKTYSGLRYCLQAAKKQNANRIFYFAPFRSIIGQNTKEFIKVFGDPSYILEHHSDAVLDTKDEMLLQQLQRWQGPALISTTMVQFLNTMFAAPRQNVRRFCALANSILLFDEIQSLPLQHTYLFNMAINFLAEHLHCTVVLCTATQPASEELAYPVHFSSPKDIVPNYQRHFDLLRRTHIVLPDLQEEYNESRIADFVLDKLSGNRSVLVILNTRHAVDAVFSKVREFCPEGSHLYCLTTNLCAQHRSDLIEQLRQHLDNVPDPSPIICISTQLIEAGVDLSFDCVIRSMAGLPSIAQAAGRCNRHGEGRCRPVYLLSVSEQLENLDSLEEILNGKLTTRRLLHQLPPGADLLSPDSIQAYYRLYYAEASQKQTMSGPISVRDCLFSQSFTLLDLLSRNKKVQADYKDSGRPFPPHCILQQSFHTAESNFKALESSTVPIVVPYKSGESILSDFCSCQKPNAALLKAAQPYVVNITDTKRKVLEQKNALYTAAGGAVTLLRKEFYDEVQGVTTKPAPLPPLFY